MITLEDVKRDEEVRLLIEKANQNLGVIGYTEHGERHVGFVARRARKIMLELGFPERTAELAAIAGYLHDIGNVISRTHHAEFGAILAYNILKRMGMRSDEIAEIVSAIGNHHEDEGDVVSSIGAALIIGDKSDVHFSRVRNPSAISGDIHDRVNYAAKETKILIDSASKVLTLDILIDQSISPVMEYFEIFLTRMIMVKKATAFLGLNFELIINGTRLA
jgi:metal-dependent HD superfamily phosphatase/phosphodiesterase